MDKMTVRMPVAIKAKVTETLKTKIIGDLQKEYNKLVWSLNNLNLLRNVLSLNRKIRMIV